MEIDSVPVWDECLKIIQEQVDKNSYTTWFIPIVPIRTDGDVLTLQVPSKFFYEWLEDNYINVIKKAIHQVIGPTARLEYVVKKNVDLVNTPKITNREILQIDKKNNFRSPYPQLNPAYTFESFVEGDCNRLARSAGEAISKKPGITSFNPLMLYGGVGTGKTHLVHAIGNKINGNKNQHHNNFLVLYIDQNEFTNQFLNALKNNEMKEFQNFYLHVDVLILDDVQFLAGREKTLDMFFHIFNQLHLSGKQLIMTSDCPPRDLKGFPERLLSRFKWGLTADLQEPDKETKLAIIHNKMHSNKIDIHTEVAEYLALSVDTNLRDLEGVLNSLLFHATTLKEKINLDLARKVIKNIVKEIQTEVSVDYIQKTTADFFKIDVELLSSKIKKREVVIPRQVAMFFCKRYTQLTLSVIGKNFGGRDHSTVIHAVESVEDMIKTNATFKNNIEELSRRFKSHINKH